MFISRRNELLTRGTIVRKITIIILSCIFFAVLLSMDETTARYYQLQHSDNPFPTVKPENVGIKSGTLKIFSNQIQRWLEEDEIVGAVLMIIKSRKDQKGRIGCKYPILQRGRFDRLSHKDCE